MFEDKIHICAEIGINHNGDLETAMALIDAAVAAGADSVKFQKRAVELAVPEHMRDVPRETPWGTVSYLEYKYRIEFELGEYDVIDAYCKSRGITWFASCWDIPSLVMIKERYNPPFYKIASACLTDDELVLATAGANPQGPRRSVILSTGMSTMDQIRHAVGLVHGQGADLTLLHCNSTYPCPVQDLNLQCVQTLRDEFPFATIGYSGHESGLATTVATVALGARFIERHITLDRSMWGTDQAASVEPQGFARMVRDIRNVERALGDGIKRVTDGEIPVMEKLRVR